jgi:hypothetical protein
MVERVELFVGNNNICFWLCENRTLIIIITIKSLSNEEGSDSPREWAFVVVVIVVAQLAIMTYTCIDTLDGNKNN